MIEEILPPTVAAVDTRAELDVELFPAERAALGRAVEKRRREYTTARACARRALAQLGVVPGPIATGERGQPLWPEGVVGSITHCAGYRACAVARAAHLAGVGIDAEPHAPLPGGVLGHLVRPEERLPLAELAHAEPAVHWDRLLFCAKEAVYKVWYPLAACWLGFEDAALTFDPATRTFQARLLKPWPEAGGGVGDGPPLGVGPLPAPPLGASPSPAPPRGAELPSVLEGRWLVRDGLVLSAIALPQTR